MTNALDLDDPTIRQMIRYNHTPEEVWTVKGAAGGESTGTLVHVGCSMCRNSWPCPTIAALRVRQKRVGDPIIEEIL